MQAKLLREKCELLNKTAAISFCFFVLRYVVFAGTESGQMKMACAQLVVRHIQRTQQISNHYLRRKWLV
jgi:hypothetical protein